MWSWSHRLHAAVAFSLDLAPSVSSQLTLKECPLPQPRTTVPDEGNMNTSYEITLVPSIQFQCYISPDSFEAGEVFCCETWPEITLMPSRVKNSIRAMSMSFVPLGGGEHWLFRITDISTELWYLSAGESLPRVETDSFPWSHGHNIHISVLHTQDSLSGPTGTCVCVSFACIYTTTQNLFFLFFWPVFFLYFFLVDWHNLASLPRDATHLVDVSEALRHFLPSSSFRLTNGSDETRSPSGCKRSCSFYGCCPLLPTRVSNQRIFLFYFTGLLRSSVDFSCSIVFKHVNFGKYAGLCVG